MNKIEMLDAIIELRHVNTLLSNFLNVEPDSDSRIRTSYSIKETGRTGSGEDELGQGSHIQNIPPNLRKMFVADPGKVMVEADKKQGEVMIVAWLAGEEKMKSVFKQGGDIHQFNADNLGVDRKFAKKYTHGWDYGLVGKTKEELGAREKYFKTYPKLLVWQERIKQEVSKRRCLTNCFGRRRMFFERVGNKLFQEAWAYIPQSTLSDDTKMGMLRLFFKYEPKMELLHDGHDSLLVQVEEGKEEWAARVMKEEMEKPFLCGEEMLTVPVEVKWGKSWGEMNEVK